MAVWSWLTASLPVYVPYEWFGMKSGDVIRMAFTDEKSTDGGQSEVRRVKLK
jgi:hypothetical protein